MTIALVLQCSWAIQQHSWNCNITHTNLKTDYTRTNITNHRNDSKYIYVNKIAVKIWYSLGRHRVGTHGNAVPGPPFLQSGVPRPHRALLSVGTQGSQAGKIVIYCYCLWLAGRNVKYIIADEIVQWTTQSEFDQDNGLTRITGAAAKLKGAHRFLQEPNNFYRSRYLKITL